MRGVILAGGLGSRMSPITDVINKHILPIGLKHVIEYPVSMLVDSGINEIVIVTNSKAIGPISEILGDGSKHSCHILYAIQNEPLGLAHALEKANLFIKGHDFVLVLGDNMFEHDLAKHIDAFYKDKLDAYLLLTEVTNPEEFGAVQFKDDKIERIVEKSNTPPSNKISIGAYIYKSSIVKFASDLHMSARGEYEITDFNNKIIDSHNVGYGYVDGWWEDVGTFPAYERILKRFHD